MFCRNCGAEVDSFLSNCIFCGDSLKYIKNAIINEKNNIVASMFPDISKCKGFKINFMGYDLYYDYHYDMLSKSNLIFGQIANVICHEFEEYISKLYTLDSLLEKGCKKADELLSDMTDMAFAFLNKYRKGKLISINSLKKYTSFSSDNRIRECRQILMEINYLSDSIKHARAEQRSTEIPHQTGVWVGGGFGIRGAIRGRINAAVLNAGTRALNQASTSIKRYLEDSSDDKIIQKMKDEIFLNGEIQKEMILVFREICLDISSKVKKLLIPRLDISEDKFQSELEEIQRRIECDSEIDPVEYANDILYLFARDPFNISFYKTLYAYKNGKYGKQLSRMAGMFFDEDKLQKEFLISDSKYLNDNISKIDDEITVSINKWKNMHELEMNNPAYFNDRLSTHDIVVMFKDNMFELWSRFFQQMMDEKDCKAESILSNANLSDSWVSLEKNAPVEYFVYQGMCNEYCDIINSGDINKFSQVSTDLKKHIDAKSNTALCIWSAIMVAISINRRESASKYQNIIKELAGKGNVLAASILGDYYMRGVGIFNKDENKGEKILRKLVWKFSPLATAYFGKFYANGECGYKKNPVLAEAFLKCGKKYMVPFAKTQLDKLYNR